MGLNTLKHQPAKVAAIEMPRNRRFRVWLRWVRHYGDRVREDECGTVCYLVRDAWGGLAIEMIDMVPPEAASTARPERAQA